MSESQPPLEQNPEAHFKSNKSNISDLYGIPAQDLQSKPHSSQNNPTHQQPQKADLQKQLGESKSKSNIEQKIQPKSQENQLKPPKPSQSEIPPKQEQLDKKSSQSSKEQVEKKPINSPIKIPTEPAPLALIQSQEINQAIEERIATLTKRIMSVSQANLKYFIFHMTLIEDLEKALLGRMRFIDQSHDNVRQTCVQFAKKAAVIAEVFKKQKSMQNALEANKKKKNLFPGLERIYVESLALQEKHLTGWSSISRQLVQLETKFSTIQKSANKNIRKSFDHFSKVKDNYFKAKSKLCERIALKQKSIMELQQICTSDTVIRACLKDVGKGVIAIWHDMQKFQMAYYKELQTLLGECSRIYKEIFSQRELKSLDTAITGLNDLQKLQHSFQPEQLMPKLLCQRISQIIPHQEKSLTIQQVQQTLTLQFEARVLLDLSELMKSLNLKTFEVQFDEGFFGSWKRACLQVSLNKMIYITAINSGEVYETLNARGVRVSKKSSVEVILKEEVKGILFNSKHEVRLRFTEDDQVEQLCYVLRQEQKER